MLFRSSFNRSTLPGGNVLRLKEVADVELGDEYYNYSSEVNGHPAAMMLINQKAGSNASSTIKEIHEVLDDLSRDLPEGTEFVVLTDTNKFLYASIHSVLRTLLEAILLVIVVVYVFLQDIKSTLIPTISIFVSIIGTFAVMSMIGFSINLLTLFALVLAIGTVVDDAIVVMERLQELEHIVSFLRIAKYTEKYIIHSLRMRRGRNCCIA